MSFVNSASSIANLDPSFHILPEDTGILSAYGPIMIPFVPCGST